jgi:hypothetical protein
MHTQKPYIKEGQSIQWSKEKRTKEQTMNDLQYTRQKTKDQATRTPLVSFGHCIDCPSLIYGFWVCLWYLLAIVLTVWSKDTKCIPRSRISKKDSQYNGQKKKEQRDKQ